MSYKSKKRESGTASGHKRDINVVESLGHLMLSRPVDVCVCASVGNPGKGDRGM